MPLPEPVGRQRDVLFMAPKGHVVVLGTAGSGKTTLAIHRAVHLADVRAEHGGRTLLVTFNTALVTYLHAAGGDRLGNVDVRTYHRFAAGYLHSRGFPMTNAILDHDRRLALIRQAMTKLRTESATPSPLLDRAPQVLANEIGYIQKNGVTTVTEYVAMERVGRAGVRMERRERPLVWGVYDAYRELRARAGKTWDWDDLATSALSALREDPGPRLYRHIVIDEGQDLSPEMLRSLVAAVPEDGSVTFFGDTAQQIYGRGISWRGAGFVISKPVEFRENYRNSRQIARLALAMSRMPHYRDVEDLVEPSQPTHDGPPVTVVPLESVQAEIDFAIHQANLLGRTQRVAILYRDRTLERQFAAGLAAPAVRVHRDMATWSEAPGRWYGTYWAAKGLEFDTVILPFCSVARLPDPDLVRSFGEEEAMADDGRVLYVGVTRAKRGLIITYSGQITALLPTAPELYEVLNP